MPAAARSDTRVLTVGLPPSAARSPRGPARSAARSLAAPAACARRRARGPLRPCARSGRRRPRGWRARAGSPARAGQPSPARRSRAPSGRSRRGRGRGRCARQRGGRELHRLLGVGQRPGVLAVPDQLVGDLQARVHRPGVDRDLLLELLECRSWVGLLPPQQVGAVAVVQVRRLRVPPQQLLEPRDGRRVLRQRRAGRSARRLDQLAPVRRHGGRQVRQPQQREPAGRHQPRAVHARARERRQRFHGELELPRADPQHGHVVVDLVADLGVADRAGREPACEIAQRGVVALPAELRQAQQRPGRPRVRLQPDEAREGPHGFHAVGPLVGQGADVPPALVPRGPRGHRLPVPAQRLVGRAGLARGRGASGRFLERDRFRRAGARRRRRSRLGGG